METYREFLDRINTFEKKQPEFGATPFTVNSSLTQKVGIDNKFKPFYGDTVVFDLSNEVKSRLCDYVNLLYNVAPQCFCERLNTQTFHMTLHDLSNNSTLSDVAEELLQNEINVTKKVSEFEKLQGVEIRLKCKYVFNMVNTSLVLGLYPIDETHHCLLSQLYSVLDGVKTLSYLLTPHITLAYYNVHGFDAHAAKVLSDTVARINNTLDFEITVRDLYYQKFASMNEYKNVIKLL